MSDIPRKTLQQTPRKKHQIQKTALKVVILFYSLWTIDIIYAKIDC